MCDAISAPVFFSFGAHAASREGRPKHLILHRPNTKGKTRHRGHYCPLHKTKPCGLPRRRQPPSSLHLYTLRRMDPGTAIPAPFIKASRNPKRRHTPLSTPREPVSVKASPNSFKTNADVARRGANGQSVGRGELERRLSWSIVDYPKSTV